MTNLLIGLIVLTIFTLWFILLNAIKVGKCSSTKWHSVLFILVSPILLGLLVIIVVVIPLGNIIQTIVIAILKITFGEKYYGIVRGTDVSMGCNEWNHSFIKTLLVVEYNKTIATRTVFEYTKELFEKSKLDKKFFATLKRSLGYLFFEKINVKMSDLINEMPLSANTLDRSELVRFLQSCMYKDLPFGDKALWDVQVGTQPLKWRLNPDPNIEYYPILIRTHHVLGDGIMLAKHLKMIFADEQVVKPTNFDKPDTKKVCYFRSLYKRICGFLNIIVFFISAMYISLILTGHDHNDLHSKPFTNEDVFQFATDEDGKYFKKVKKIKKLCGGISFSEILISAYSASLDEYYKKYSSRCPESITLVLPVLLDQLQLNTVSSGELDTKTSVGNNFIFLQMPFPINITNSKEFNPKTPCISRLNIIRKATKHLRSPSQQTFNYVMVHLILGCLPVWAIQTFLRYIDNTTAGSFLPGPLKFSFCNGALAVSNCLFWLTHMIKLGLGFSSFTFDNRLQMGLTCNGQISKQSQVDEILYNIYKYIDLAEKELETYSEV